MCLVGPLVALEHRLGRLPATQLAEHLEWLVHEVGGELPPQGMPASAGLRVELTSLNPVFVSYQLASKGGQAQFDRLNREGVKAGLNFNDVKSIRLTNPPLNLQHRFAAIAESVEEQKTRQRAHLAELDTLFASLQSRAFRGDL